MNIRNLIELQDWLDSTLKMRKRELTTLSFLFQQTSRNHEKAALVRALIPIVYSHWEGYLKSASIAYLSFVSSQARKYRDVKMNFLAIGAKSRIREAGRAQRTGIHLQMVEDLFRMLDETIAFDPDNAVDAESNLNSEVLRNIFATVGLDFTSYWQMKMTYLDYDLLKTRNEISHGELVNVSEQKFKKSLFFVIETLDVFKSAIENAASLKEYAS